MIRRNAALIVVNLIGLIGILWPLVLGVGADAQGVTSAHVTDAPLLIALSMPLLIVVGIQLTRAGGDARMIALLGALVAINAFLRIPKGPSGEGFIFILPILAGWFIGTRFAFLLGAFSLLASAVITAGVGPWLPFQMFALGWVGAGAGLLRRALGGRMPRLALGAYAYASSIAFGYLMTLFFWPFLGESGELFFDPSQGLIGSVVRYTRYWTLTSLPWDTARAVLVNVPLVVVLAVPVGRLFERVRERFTAEVVVGTPLP